MQLSLKRAWPFGANQQGSMPSLREQPSFHSPSEAWNSRINENSCFGSIIDAEVQLYDVRSLNRYYTPSRSPAQSFTIAREGGYFALEYAGDKLGRLTKGLCKHLHTLTANSRLQLQAYTPVEAWMTTLRRKHLAESSLITVDINIYGTREDADEVGRSLSKSGLFLQWPRYGLDGFEYHNPHILRIEGFPEQNPTEISVDDISKLPEQDSDDGHPVTDSGMVESILDSLSHHVLLQEISVDRRIKSMLLPHQKEAIDFIFTRETGQVPSQLSLWRYNEVDEDEPFYQHVFSGAKRPQQEEARGGIVADEMGLGKSLVILSTIASSLDRADSFAVNESQLVAAQPLRKPHSRATLILAPSSLLIDSWVEEIRKHTYPGALSFHKHLGPRRHEEVDLLRKQMIVFTTYATVAAEVNRGENTLTKINWFRIVLDEAHDIRNRTTKQFEAVASLSAQNRWCLTGTPIQNSLEDLGSLVSFLRVPILENPPAFRKFITSPITSTSRDRFQNLRTLLGTICLRRRRELLELPEPESRIRRLTFTPVERAEYEGLLRNCRTEIDMAVSGHRKKKIHSTVLESLLKLRLFCNNGNANTTLRGGMTTLPPDPDEALAYLQQYDQDICAYCSKTIYTIDGSADTDGGIFISSCSHLVCRSCVPHHRARQECCPACESRNESPPPAMSIPIESQFRSHRQSKISGVTYLSQPPSKLLTLLSDIRNDPTHKSIVFSCWKKTLCLVGQLFNSHAIRYDMIDGSLSLNDRIKVLRDFRSPNGSNILLMTLGTGAVGLNLAVASRIYLLEPQWNPSIESQAIGRALRLGQTAQVVIIRYIMTDTVEESDVLSRQETKLQLAGRGFGKGKDMSERLGSLMDVLGIDWRSSSQ